MHRWGSFVARRALAVLLVGIVVVLGAGAYGSGVFDRLSQGGFDDPSTQSAQELDREREIFGNRSVDVVAIYSDPDAQVTDPSFRAEVQSVVDGLPGSAVSAAVTYYDTQDPSLISQDGHSTQVLISLQGADQNALLENWDRIQPRLQADGLRADVAGAFAVFGDVNDMTSHDLERAELVSMPLVVLLALLIFGSVVAALMPAIVGLAAMLGSLALVRLLTGFTDVSIFSVNVISLLGMGLAIDYALFVISRFREELSALPTDHPDAVSQAIVRTMATAGRTVLFSGLTVAAALSSLLVFPQNFLKSMGYGGISAVLIAMAAALTLLPATLRLLGRRVDAGRLPWLRRRPTATDDDHGWWARLAHGVMRRPVLVIVGVMAALLVVASPFVGVKWGSVDYHVLPADAPAHVAAEKLNTEFGAERSSASVLVQGADQAALASYTQALEAVDGVDGVQPVAQEGDATLLRAGWPGNSQTERSQDIVKALRDVPAPADSEVLVGGMTANTVDLLGSVGDHLLWMGLIVVVVMLVLLFLAFGSVVLPIKAIVMNAVSITASFGVVTWIFADGHLADQLGFVSAGYLDATNPLVMLAILFGLSMDYEVFLLSRVREQWDRTGDNDLAVATGVQKTGRLITSAALLLGVVIGAFALSGVVFMKMIGVGMLVALLIDATIVRALLVPATMKLLGRWNWWAPGPMLSWWERHGWRETDEVAPTAHGPRSPETAGV